MNGEIKKLKNKISTWYKIQLDNRPSAWEIQNHRSPLPFVHSKDFRAGNLTMGVFTLIFSMIRRKHVSLLTGEILEFLWEHYGMSKLVKNFSMKDLREKYKSREQKFESKFKPKYLRHDSYLKMLPENMRTANFMAEFHKLSQEWEKNKNYTVNFATIFSQFGEETHFALFEEAFILVTSGAINDFELSGALEDLGVNYLLLYIRRKLLASFYRIKAMIYDKELDYEDTAKDVFDISLLPKIFRWSGMPDFKKRDQVKIAARELYTYAYMLIALVREAVDQRLKDGRMPRASKSGQQNRIAAQKVSPGDYTLLQSWLWLASRSFPIYKGTKSRW